MWENSDSKYTVTVIDSEWINIRAEMLGVEEGTNNIKMFFNVDA